MTKSRLDKIDGIVREIVMGGKPILEYYVKENNVYEVITGGPPNKIGFVKEGIAYESIIGGFPRRIGRVKYKYKRE